MMKNVIEQLQECVSIVRLSTIHQLGRGIKLVPATILACPLLASVVLLLFGTNQSFSVGAAQNILIGIPIYILAIGLGIGIIAGEIEQKTLEVVYTVPGNASRVWLIKLATACVLILLAEIVQAIATYILFTSFTMSTLFAAFRGAVFLLVLAMWLGTMFKNELIAAVVCAVIGFGLLTIAGSKWSPLFDTNSLELVSEVDLLIWSIQNYISVILITLILGIFAFSRADRKEELLRS